MACCDDRHRFLYEMDRPSLALRIKRNAVVVVGVLLVHIAALLALQMGIRPHAAPQGVPGEFISASITVAPVELARPPAPPSPHKAEHVVPAVQPQLAAVPEAIPTPEIVSAKVQQTVTQAPASVVAPAPAPASVELPSSNAGYLQNPKPPYPPMSKRLGEQGRVVIRVLIGADGLTQKAEIFQSSGFERLDQVALATVQRWRYVPGKRGGIPEAMWFNVPIQFVLQ